MPRAQLLALAGTASAGLTTLEGFDMPSAFGAFKVQFGKSYGSADEEARRFSTFSDNLARAAEHNANYEDAAFHSQGINLFSDMTLSEVRAQRTGHNKRGLGEAQPTATMAEVGCPACKLFPVHAEYTANSLNWTSKGAVGPVRDQGPCGACWAFASTADVEGSQFLDTGKFTSLSMQQTVACDHDGELNDGCLGGLGTNNFNYLLGKLTGHEKVGGLVSYQTWPWASDMGPGDDCKADSDCKAACTQIGDKTLAPTCDDEVCKCQPTCQAKLEDGPYGGMIDGWLWVSQSAKSEAGMTQALAKYGPIDIAIDAGGIAGYVPGTVIRPTKALCDPTNVDHEVLLTGFGTLNGVDYWEVKNSWGTGFGASGYFLIERGVNGCGMATDAATSYRNSTASL